MELALSDDEIATVNTLKLFIGEFDEHDDENMTVYDLVIFTLVDAIIGDIGISAQFSDDEKSVVRDRFDLLQEIRRVGETTDADLKQLEFITERMHAIVKVGNND